jgi:hypothetical protein
MAITFNHSSNKKINDAFRDIIQNTLENNDKFLRLREVKTVAVWYKQTKEFKQTLEASKDKNPLLSMVANKTIEKLLDKAEPYYEQFLLKKVEIKTQFKDGAIESDFKVGLLPITAHVDFIKVINRNEVCKLTFKFQLNTDTYVRNLRISYDQARKKECHIERLGIEFKLALVQVSILYIRTSELVFPMNKEIKLAHKKFELRDVIID